MRYEEYRSIPNNLRKLRLEYGYNQTQIARILGLKNTSKLSRWEHGARLPNLLNAFKLAGVYSVMVEALFKDLRDEVQSEVKARMAEVLHGMVRRE